MGDLQDQREKFSATIETHYDLPKLPDHLQDLEHILAQGVLFLINGLINLSVPTVFVLLSHVILEQLRHSHYLVLLQQAFWFVLEHSDEPAEPELILLDAFLSIVHPLLKQDLSFQPLLLELVHKGLQVLGLTFQVPMALAGYKGAFSLMSFDIFQDLVDGCFQVFLQRVCLIVDVPGLFKGKTGAEQTEQQERERDNHEASVLESLVVREEAKERDQIEGKLAPKRQYERISRIEQVQQDEQFYSQEDQYCEGIPVQLKGYNQRDLQETVQTFAQTQNHHSEGQAGQTKRDRQVNEIAILKAGDAFDEDFDEEERVEEEGYLQGDDEQLDGSELFEDEGHCHDAWIESQSQKGEWLSAEGHYQNVVLLDYILVLTNQRKGFQVLIIVMEVIVWEEEEFEEGDEEAQRRIDYCVGVDDEHILEQPLLSADQALSQASVHIQISEPKRMSFLQTIVDIDRRSSQSCLLNMNFSSCLNLYISRDSIPFISQQPTRLQQAYQRQLAMKPSRITTEELIQQTRSHYDRSKYQQRIQELELTLQLKNKEVQCLANQLTSIKQDNGIRIKQLQAEAVSLKKEMAEIRVKQVRTIREESEKYEKALEALRKEQEVQLKQNSSQWHKKYEELVEAQRIELTNLKQQYEGYIQLEKQEVAICKSINQQQNHRHHLTISQLQEDKKGLILARKEAEAKIKLYQDALEAAKLQLESQTGEKDQTIARLKGEIEALRLKHQLLEEKLLSLKKRQQQSNSNILKIQQLQQINNKLIDDNERVRAMLANKEQEYLQKLKQSHHLPIKQKQIEVQMFQCNHSGLIHQFETSLHLKERQIQELKTIIEKWTMTIGFDRPLSERLAELAEISQNTQNFNENWLKKLKGKKQVKAGKTSRFIQ